MKKYLGVMLGIVTAIGGYVEVGAIITAGQAGSIFGFGLIWCVLLATACVIFLIEMVGRIAAMGDKAYADILREKFGFKFALLPLSAQLIVNFLLLAAEIAGAAFALYLITDVSFQLWAFAIAPILWLLFWRGSFSLVENGPGLLGLVTLCFVVAASVQEVPWVSVAKQAVLPSIDGGDAVQYFYIAASIFGANILPYLLFFYSSGAQEKGWTKDMLRPNYLIAAVGMGFGAACAISIILVCAVTLQPRGIQVNGLQTVALGLIDSFGIWGVYLFAATLFITCFSAATEITIATAFMITQVMGWEYGQGKKAADAPAFNLVFLVYVVGATLLIGLTGMDPLALVTVAVTLTALILPIIVVPFLAVMNDRIYLADQTNGPLGNFSVLLIVAIAFVLSVTSIPLTVLGV